MAIQDFAGKRVLASTCQKPFVTAGSFQEFRVLEVSPSGNYVRLMNPWGHKVWHLVAVVTVLETLVMPEPYPRMRTPEGVAT